MSAEGAAESNGLRPNPEVVSNTDRMIASPNIPLE
jgi:hypothetical protein